MSDHFYSAEEAAAVLGLQVRTVRNYVRDGRLAGARIGKQYRIARADLEEFAGGGGAGRVEKVLRQQPVDRRIDVSSVIEMDEMLQEAADRVIRTLEAVILARPEDAEPLRVEPLYDEQRSRLKLIVVGGAKDTADIIRLVEAVG